MPNECVAYYNKVIRRLVAAGLADPEGMFWAGLFAGICEQVMMKVKPAGMVGSEMPHAEEMTSMIADIYQLHRVRLDKPTGGFEIWVCRSDDEETQQGLARLRQGGLDWEQYHALRGRLCGYSEDVIKEYTEGVWP